MYKLPFISYIPIEEDFEDDNPYLPDLDSKDNKEKEDKKDKEETPIILQPQIVAQIPDPVKVSTPAFTPAAAPVVAETTPPVKASTPAYIVQNPYTPTKPMVTQSATNSEISIPNFSSVQRTDIPQMNSLQSGKIRIADNVVMYPELENEILGALLRFGISGTVTSAYREGAVAPSGKPSYHASRQAFDFVPRFGNSAKDFADLYARLKQSGALDYLNSKDYFILYEDNNINPDSTGPHFHIGKDISANNPHIVKAQRGAKFIKPTNPFFQFSSYNDYALPELSNSIKKLFGKNSNNVREIIVGLKDAGWNDRQIAAYLGNVYVESKANPHIANKKGGDYGLVQRVGARMEPVRSIPGLELTSQLGYDIDVMAGNVSKGEMSNE